MCGPHGCGCSFRGSPPLAEGFTERGDGPEKGGDSFHRSGWTPREGGRSVDSCNRCAHRRATRAGETPWPGASSAPQPTDPRRNAMTEYRNGKRGRLVVGSSSVARTLTPAMLVLALASPAAHGCSCARTPLPEQVAGTALTVVVEAVRSESGERPGTALTWLSVVHTVRGRAPGARLVVAHRTEPTACGLWLEPGRRYLMLFTTRQLRRNPPAANSCRVVKLGPGAPPP